MDAAVERKAKDLAETLAASDVYKQWVAARENIEDHEAAKIMLRDLQQLQEELQRKQLSHGQLDESDMEKLKRTSELVSANPYVRALIEAEMNFAQMMTGVQKILGEAVGLDFGGDEEEGGGGPPKGPAAPPEDQPPRPQQSRIWTPS